MGGSRNDNPQRKSRTGDNDDYGLLFLKDRQIDGRWEIPVLNLKDLAKATKKEKLGRPSPFHDPGDGQALLDWVKKD